MTEQLPKNPPIPGQRLGEVALQAQESRDLFEVREEELVALIPSTADGQQTFKEFLAVMNPVQATQENAREGDSDGTEDQYASAATDKSEKKFNRGQIREGKNIYAGHIARIIQTGARYISTFDNDEEGEQAGRSVFIEELDELLGDLYTTRLVPAAKPLRHLHQVSRQAVQEIEALAGDDETNTTKRYTLLKALADVNNDKDKDDDTKKESYDSLPASGTLACLIAIEGVDVQRQMANDLQAGTFDRHIALDILNYLDRNQDVDNGLAKVRHLVTFLSSYLGNEQPDRPDFHDRMVAMLDQWPPTQRQVITEFRQVLLGHLQAKLNRTIRALKESGLIGTDDPQEAFKYSIQRLADEVLKRANMRGPQKAQIMAVRARLGKRGRVTPRRQRNKGASPTTEEETSAETQREPLKLVTCNLNDYSIHEGVDSLIDEFIRETSQGNVTLRDDLERILSFMARTDLPPEHRRGVKSINGARVRFGIEEDPDKLWDFFELKPSEAAGLSTKTSIAKSLRVYFIKMENNTLGIIGIKPRSEQEAFLKSIRVKTKQRG